MWRIEDIALDMLDDMTSDPVVTVSVATPDGTLSFMAEPEVRGSILVLHGLHAQDARANTVGVANPLVLAQALMEGMGFDGLVVEGALRTSGANPGHRPRVLRFARRVRAAPAAGASDAPDD